MKDQGVCFYFFLSLLVTASCTKHKSEEGTPFTKYDPQTSLEYRFDRVSNECRNSKNEVGYNSGYIGECGFLEERDLSNQDLRARSFRGARLKNANFGGADLRDSDFRGADLSGANFYQEAQFKGALVNPGTKFSVTEGEVTRLGFVKKSFSETDTEFSTFLERTRPSEEKLQRLRLFIAWGADLNLSSGFPLRQASLPEMKLLLAAGANPNGISTNGYDRGSPIIVATDKKCYECISLLQSYGADVDQVMTYPGPSALALASQKGDLETLEFLLKQGARVNQEIGLDRYSYAGFGKGSALTVAKDRATVDFLLEKGASIKYRILVLEEDLGYILKLISLGADINQTSADKGRNIVMTLLNRRRFSMRWKTQSQILEDLLKLGLVLEHRDKAGSSLLAYANIDLALTLIEKGLDVKKPYDAGGTGVLAEMIKRRFGGDCDARGFDPKFEKLVSLLIANGADVRARNTDGDGPVMALVRPFLKCRTWDPLRERLERTIGQLRQAGADFNEISSKDQTTPLTLAASSLHKGWLEILLQNAADVNKIDEAGRSPLGGLLLGDSSRNLELRLQLIDFLTNKGADIGVNSEGFSLLEKQLMEQAPMPLIQKLIEAGADPQQVNSRGQSMAMVYLSHYSCRLVDRKPTNPIFDLLVKELDPRHTDHEGNSLVHYLSPKRSVSISSNNGGSSGNLPAEWLLCFADALAEHDFNLPNAEGERILPLILSRMARHGPYFFHYFTEADLLAWLEVATTRGLDLHQTDLSGNNLLRLAKNSMLLQVGNFLLGKGISDDGVLASPKPPQDTWTPINACSEQLLSLGWRNSDGGCRSVHGEVWSMSSRSDHCYLNRRGKYECDDVGATGLVPLNSSYCSRLRQGERRDWKVPGHADYLRALFLGYFTQHLGETIIQHTNPRNYYAVEAKTGEWWSRTGATEAYAFCIAK